MDKAQKNKGCCAQTNKIDCCKEQQSNSNCCDDTTETMNSHQGCDCGSGQGLKLVFACSGASDVGALSDQAARKLSREQIAKMYCLAAIGARRPMYMETTASAEKIIAIDGCSEDCAKNALQLAGFENIIHVRLSDLGFEKGKSPVTYDKAVQIAEECAKRLHS